jgi:ankyrin repeat protein
MGYFKKPVIASDGNVYCENCINTWTKNNSKGLVDDKKITHWVECKMFNNFYACGLIRTDMNLFRLIDQSISDVSKCNDQNDAIRIMALIDNENSHRLREEPNNTSVIGQIFSDKQLIKKIINLLDKEWHGVNQWTILHYLFRFGSIDLIDDALDRNMYDLNAETDDGWQLIHFISSNLNIIGSVFGSGSRTCFRIFKFLVECGVDLENTIESEDMFNGWKLIHFVTSDMNNFSESGDQLNALKLLLDHGIDMNAVTNKGVTALNYICSDMNHFTPQDQLKAIEMVIKFTELNKDDIASSIKYLMCGNRLTMDQVMTGISLLTHCFKDNLNLNTIDKNGDGIAHFICGYGKNNVSQNLAKYIEYLINHNVNFNTVNANGHRPIDILLSKERDVINSQQMLKIIKLFLKNQIDMSSQSVNGNSPAHKLFSSKSCLCSADQLEVIELFIKNQIDITQMSSEGTLAVNLICGADNNLTSDHQLRAIEILMDNDISMNKRDARSWATCQHICSISNKMISSNQLKAIKMLTMYEIDFNAPDDNGWRPIHDVCSQGNHMDNNDQYEAIKILINHGVDLNVSTMKGGKPLHQIVGGASKLGGDQCVEITKLMISAGADKDSKDSDGKTLHEIANNNRHAPATIARLQLLFQ